MNSAEWHAEIAMRERGMEGVGLAGDALRRALTTAFEAGERAGAAGAAHALMAAPVVGRVPETAVSVVPGEREPEPEAPAEGSVGERRAGVVSGRVAGILATLGFGGSVVLANYLTTTLGFVPVGFGLAATAGTFVAGVALVLRDVIQDALGRGWVVGAILGGALLSWTISDPVIAFASTLAFLLSELLDFAVYSPLRARSRFGGRRWAVAVVASNLVGAVADTLVFLAVAFGAAAVLPALPGQMVGKAWATVAFLLIGWAVTRAVLRKSEHPVGA